MKILVVDDLPANARLLRAQLGAEGHTVLTAANGLEALAELEREPVDAIISDILMPVMDGYRLCFEVRRSERLRHLPFLIYTATYTSPSDEKLCRELGADKYIRKPASPTVILSALKEVLEWPRRASPSGTVPDEYSVMREYSERLVNKLEERSIELDDALERLRANQAELKRSEQQLRLLVEHSPAAIAMLDRDMRYLVTSRRWLADFGLGDEAVTGRSHYDVFPEIPERWKEIHRRCLDGATEKCDEDPFIRADGTTDWIRWEIHPWHDKQDRVGGLLILSEDITARKQAEQALLENVARFHALAENASDVTVVMNRDGVISHASHSVKAIGGYDPEELVGGGMERVIHPDDFPIAARTLAEVIRRPGQAHRNVLRVRMKDGSWRTFETVARNLLAVPAVTGIVCTMRDVTERTRAEAELRLQSAALTAAGNAIVMTDRRGSIAWVNPAFTLLTGYSAAEAVGKNPRELLKSGKQSPEFYKELWDTILAGRTWRGELVNRRKDGSLYHEDQTITPVLDAGGTVTHFVAIKQDLTERKRAETALLEANASLERGIAARTAELLAAKERAEAADRHKSQFLANMSHELRTPLNAIIGFTGTLLMKLPGALNAAQEEQLTVVQASARHLLSLINDLLDVARIESGKVELNLEPVTCQALLEEIAATQRPLAEKKGLSFTLQAPAGKIRMLTDARVLKQIVLNLCSNAIKFTDAGAITVELKDRDATRPLEISVTDSGIGIGEEDRDKVFQAYARMDSSTREGTGLGLHLSRKLAGLLGGTMGFESQRGRGSRFWLTLPPEAPWPAS